MYKNHVYETNELKDDKNFKLMFKVVTELSKDYKYLKKINDSHDMVALFNDINELLYITRYGKV